MPKFIVRVVVDKVSVEVDDDVSVKADDDVELADLVVDDTE